jgi:putative spermidine/putrescine transport system substrate-binding protein
MPTSEGNTKKYYLVDSVYWADNGTELGEMWTAMTAGLK